MKKNETMENDHLLSKIATVQKEDADKYCTVYKMDCNDGYGIMTVYEVFEGIELIYNEFNATSCFCGMQSYDNIMEINHCREGRDEFELQNGAYLYMGEGDFSVHMMNNHAITTEFPLKHYRGISVALYLDKIPKKVCKILNDFSIDVYKLKEKFCTKNRCFTMRAKDKIEHVFSEIYCVPQSAQKAYLKLKVLELLLILNVMDITKENQRQQYYPKQKVEIVKQVKTKMTQDLSRRYTIEELTKEYAISRTALKTYFKGIYGISIATFMKKYRMQYAASLLRKTQQSIADIANCVGYENQSKFSATFKEIMGKNPSDYRKIII